MLPFHGMGDMIFDLKCPRCACRHERRWLPQETVLATPCPSCREAMMVVAIAFDRAGAAGNPAGSPRRLAA